MRTFDLRIMDIQPQKEIAGDFLSWEGRYVHKYVYLGFGLVGYAYDLPQKTWNPECRHVESLAAFSRTIFHLFSNSLIKSPVMQGPGRLNKSMMAVDRFSVRAQKGTNQPLQMFQRVTLPDHMAVWGILFHLRIARSPVGGGFRVDPDEPLAASAYRLDDPRVRFIIIVPGITENQHRRSSPHSIGILILKIAEGAIVIRPAHKDGNVRRG